MTAVLEPTARRGFLSIPAEPWIPAQYDTGRLIHNPPDDHATSPLTCDDVTGFRGL